MQVNKCRATRACSQFNASRTSRKHDARHSSEALVVSTPNTRAATQCRLSPIELPAHRTQQRLVVASLPPKPRLANFQFVLKSSGPVNVPQNLERKCTPVRITALSHYAHASVQPSTFGRHRCVWRQLATAPATIQYCEWLLQVQC